MYSLVLKVGPSVSALVVAHQLPDFSQRIHAAASAGFRCVEAAWLYDSELQELQSAREAAGVEVVLINTPPGDVMAGDLGLGAVPGREAEFRQGLDMAIKYAKALDCKRIHLMAGRVPVGSHRTAVAKEMEAIFVQNLTYAADILSKKEQVLESIKTVGKSVRSELSHIKLYGAEKERKS
ncbi:hypothetical protein F2P81_005984 [Scophthalmus maximus]|uniref:Xylose isomerase-like TIM barrel domain-containing protein n=1 Tax=Scophthalmus maximus TaxID=52904 RepID=A0A6A4TKB2_SCOMX|nr:hypothetical protein F2P81_005984 [Scophthalmus maximus]